YKNCMIDRKVIFMKSLVSIWVALVMSFVNFVPGFVPPQKAENVKSYPYIFVHGFLGWGEDEGINDDLPYWGATSCNLIDNLNKEGYEAYDASVGPFTSNWDRACELYAQLTGTTVDYGEAHSQKHNHLRYGRTYEKPLIESWGEKNENGLYNKINLIGHSFGGNTVRMLMELLANGDKDELRITSPDTISPLFTGGKSDWVNSVVTICSPNNGTTLGYIVTDMGLVDPVETLMYIYAGIMGRSVFNGYVDFHMEQFGLTYAPGVKKSRKSIYNAVKNVMQSTDDNVAKDLMCDGVEEFNQRTGTEDNVYYFSYAFSTTKTVPLVNTEIPLPSTLAILQPFATLMGAYKENTQTDFSIDKSWRENDGLVNVVSAKYPFGAPHTDYDKDNIRTGIWNVMPLSVGDHGNAIGIGVSEEYTMNYYNGMIEMIENLPVVS
ncbi:MAG: hypothetical protein KBT46_09480, partial [Ruminococcus sp.]|nr:hypothetical protein [Candidatus Copronaster equi]